MNRFDYYIVSLFKDMVSKFYFLYAEKHGMKNFNFEKFVYL